MRASLRVIWRKIDPIFTTNIEKSVAATTCRENGIEKKIIAREISGPMVTSGKFKYSVAKSELRQGSEEFSLGQIKSK